MVHSHIGFDCIIADYLHKRKFPVVGPLATWTLRATTLATLYGLYEFNTSESNPPGSRYADDERSFEGNVADLFSLCFAFC